MSQVSLNSREIKDFLRHIIANNRVIQEQGKVPVAVEIQGEAGLGKTTIVAEVAKEHNLNFVKLNLAQIEELGDLTGFPLRQFEMCKELTPAVQAEPRYEMQTVEQVLPDGRKIQVKQKVLVTESTDAVLSNECLWVDETAVIQYTKQGYNFSGRKRMSYCPPEWIVGKENGGILLLDDYSRADLRFSQATMELIDKQEYISWKLPKDWTIILKK